MFTSRVKQQHQKHRPHLQRRRRACLVCSRVRRALLHLYRSPRELDQCQRVSSHSQNYFAKLIALQLLDRNRPLLQRRGLRLCLSRKAQSLATACRSFQKLHLASRECILQPKEEYVLMDWGSVIAQQPHHLPIVTFATVEEMYRRGKASSTLDNKIDDMIQVSQRLLCSVYKAASPE